MKKVPTSRTDVERHVEKSIRELVDLNQPGSCIEIQQFDFSMREMQAAVVLWAGRLIRRPCGNRNGTFKMNKFDNERVIRVMLVNKIPTAEE